MGRVAALLLVVGTAAFAFAGCNLIQEKLSPTEPTSTTATPAPLAIPVILPKASPTPTPTLAPPTSPTPSPNPTPTPTSTPAPTGGSCSLPASGHPDAPCSMGSESFLSEVDKAITQLTQQQPALFDFNQKNCDNCYYVKDQARFVSGVIKNLNAMGICATYDGEELGVKNSNAFNDQYDILVSSGHIRRGQGSYRSTCQPSWF
jgi:hypothetical protein